MKILDSSLACAAGLAIATVAVPCGAQATRTWVSGVGDDANPCSRTAPCKTFAGAISKTAANGEINCLDPGGYGALTITKSITIDCTGTFGSSLNSGTNGFVVNDSLTAAPNSIDVILRGLALNGGGSLSGMNGVRFTSGRSLVLKDILIENENAGSGISFQPSGAAELYAEDVTITDSGVGILVQPTGGSGSAKIVLRNVRADNNSTFGLQVNTTGATGAGVISLAADHCSFSGNSTGVQVITPSGTIQTGVMLTNCIIANNSAIGLHTTGSTAVVRVGFTTITGNATGVSAVNGSTASSYGNNRNIGNPTSGAPSNGSFTGAVIPSQ